MLEYKSGLRANPDAIWTHSGVGKRLSTTTPHVENCQENDGENGPQNGQGMGRTSCHFFGAFRPSPMMLWSQTVWFIGIYSGGPKKGISSNRAYNVRFTCNQGKLCSQTEISKPDHPFEGRHLTTSLAIWSLLLFGKISIKPHDLINIAYFHHFTSWTNS